MEHGLVPVIKQGLILIPGSTHTSRKVMGSCTLRSHTVQSGATGESTQEAPMVVEPRRRTSAGTCKKRYFVTCTFKTPSKSDTFHQEHINLLRGISTFASNIASNPPHPAYVAANTLYSNFCVLPITRLWRLYVN